MKENNKSIDRRTFIKASGFAVTGTLASPLIGSAAGLAPPAFVPFAGAAPAGGV